MSTGNAQPKDDGDAERAAQLYSTLGLSVRQVAEIFRLSMRKARALIIAGGATIRPIGGGTDLGPRGSSHHSSKLSPDDRMALETALFSGVTHVALARTYGVSRERVRQIAVEIGAPTGRDLQRLKKAKTEARHLKTQKKRIVERERKFEERYVVWRELWNEGLTVGEIARRFGRSTATVNQRIVKLRNRFPDWFPYRSTNHGPQKAKSVRADTISEGADHG